MATSPVIVTLGVESVTPPRLTVEAISTQVTVEAPQPIQVAMDLRTVPVPPPPVPPAPPELVDSATPPLALTAASVYLRFERDLDGDVQRIYLGTET